MRDPFAGADLDERLARQLAFCLEIDKVKHVVRRNDLTDGSRRENDAEHQWHLAVMAVVLAEHADEPVDVHRVVGMLLVHDLVEIDAGDAFVYDPAARAAAVEKEARAAERIFGLLPAEQGKWLRGLWEEFEAGDTADARFAAALDKLHPMMQNAAAGGGGWTRHGITAEQVGTVAAGIADGSAVLGRLARSLIDAAVADGVLPPS